MLFAKRSSNSSSSVIASTLAGAWRDTFLDLKVEYETLKQTHCGIQLENEEYEKHITALQRHNDELQIQLLQMKSTVNQQQHLQPMLELHISSIEDSLEDNDVQIHQLEETSHRNINTINIITAENVAIKQENMIVKQEKDRLQMELQRSHQKYDKLQQIHEDAIAANHQQISLLQDQLLTLQDEMYALQNKERFEVPAIATEVLNLPDDIPIIGDNRRSIIPLPFQLSSLHSPNGSIGLRSPSFMFQSSYFNDNEYGHDSDELQDKLLKLEEENAVLFKKLSGLEAQHEDIYDDNVDKYDDKEDIITEFDDDDLDELQELFRKCDQEKLKEDEKRVQKQQRIYVWSQFFR